MTLSLWAAPTGADAAPLAHCIERLARAADSSTFEPHITLLGSQAAVDEAAIDRAVAGLPPFVVELVALADSDARFECITLTAASDAPLLELRTRLARELGVGSPAYEPHLSLLYAELPPDRRRALREKVDLAVPRQVVVDAVLLVDTGDDDPTRWPVQHRWALSA